ncbi:hypothetical protein B6U74_01880 [Candidatus Bathyarchaeota archaeon ex4484_205]|nr:MAG: hypothetical protein B6U74_01880 [Candidatus Bathyarchaeota archaeon ex4484_205]
MSIKFEHLWLPRAWWPGKTGALFSAKITNTDDTKNRYKFSVIVKPTKDTQVLIGEKEVELEPGETKSVCISGKLTKEEMCDENRWDLTLQVHVFKDGWKWIKEANWSVMLASSESFEPDKCPSPSLKEIISKHKKTIAMIIALPTAVLIVLYLIKKFKEKRGER